MWIQNTGKTSGGKSERTNYLKLNTSDGNPAMRVSEKTASDVGYKKGDHVNIFIDKEKIMIAKDDKNQSFPVHPQIAGEKSYGFAIYGRVLKDAILKTGWDSRKFYPVNVIDNGTEKMIVCFKDEFLQNKAMNR
jgi:hypothetical protein